MATFTIVQSRQAKASSTAPSVTLLAAPAAGDLVVVVISANEDAGDVTMSTPPSGYTLVPTDGDVNKSGDVHQWMYYKIAGASESATISGILSGSRNWKIVAAQYHDSAGGTWILDKSALDSNSTNTAKSGTTATTVRSNEVFVAALTNKRGTDTQGSPSNGFGVVQNVSGSSSASDQRTVVYHKIAAAVEAAKMQASLSNTRAWVGQIATFKTNATVVGAAHFTASGSMQARGLIPTDRPTLRVEAGFGSGPTDFTPTWTSIFDYFYGATWQHGRQNELNQTAAGTGSVHLLDEFSHWDPSNVDSPFYPYVKPGVPIRAYIINGSTIYPLFRMSLERLPRVVRVAGAYTERELALIDGFAILANAGLSGFSYEAEESGARVNNVCDDINWPADARQIDPGAAFLQEIAFADDDDTSAQTHLLKVADSENGLLFCNAAGELVFVDRYQLIRNSAHTVSKAIFGDNELGSALVGYGSAPYGSGPYGGGSGTPVHPYIGLIPDFGVELVFNKWNGTTPGGVTQVWEDLDSQREFFLRSKQIESLVTTDSELLSQLQYKTGVFGQPLNRIDQITIQPIVDPTDSGYVDAGLAREVGDKITVLETPPGFATQQANDYVIQQIHGTITPGPLNSVKIDFGLWPASASASWVAGDADLSLAGVSTRPGY